MIFSSLQPVVKLQNNRGNNKYSYTRYIQPRFFSFFFLLSFFKFTTFSEFTTFAFQKAYES